MTELPIACGACLHEVTLHGLDGCRATDILGNRCACTEVIV